MQHILSLQGDDLHRLETLVFPKIATGETILFLGSGASVTDEKCYLSKEIIDYYSDAKGIKLETTDITDFVDTLSATPDFNRDEFDEYVAMLLKKLKVSDTHKVIAATPWKEIITTNYDLLIESAFSAVEGTTQESLKCTPIRDASSYNYRPANDEVKYVKLNGCLSDKKRYKFVFSSKDFERSKKFYTGVLRSLENLSPQINFLSVGYSYSDAFAKRLLERFDKINFRHKKWLFSLDPFVEDARLDYFASQRICVVRALAKDFFEAYRVWEEANTKNYNARRNTILRTPEKRSFNVSAQVRKRLEGNILQLVEGNSFRKITANDYYLGEEPNFHIVQENLDVLKETQISRVSKKVKELILAAPGETIVPTLALEGSFGTGKSTLGYRVVSRLIYDPEISCVAFEIIDATKLTSPDLKELFDRSNAKSIVLLFNGIEIDHAFKSLVRLRNQLSIEQFSEFQIIFLASIRENILAQFLKEHEYKNFHLLNVDSPLSEQEADDLVDKLQEARLVDYRDAQEKRQLVNQVVSEFDGDSLVALIGLLAHGSHYQFIRNAYDQLNDNAKKVFLFTSLLYRFGIIMPASVLRRLIDISWDDFLKEIIPYNFKNFVTRVETAVQGSDPDLFYKTRHKIISEKLVNTLLPDEDSRLAQYEFLLRKLPDTHFCAELSVDLLKALRHTGDLSMDKIDRLFDVCAEQFDEDTQFNLHYAINLQHRQTEAAYKRALSRITYAESFLEQRNHRLIHRKALLHYHLAKFYYLSDSADARNAPTHVDSAEDFFEIKVILDPFSSYSYVDYVRFEVWKLKTLTLSPHEVLRQRIKIEELLDQAERAVFDDLASIQRVKAEYLQTCDRSSAKDGEYEKFLEDLSDDTEQRQYGLILSYYYYQNDSSKVKEIIEDLEEYQYLDDVSRIMFRHLGRNLYRLENRFKFMEIVRKHPFLERTEPARYYYFLYINEIYNGHFDSAYEFLSTLRSKVGFLNPELHEIWREDSTGKPKVFVGRAFLKNGRFRKIYISEIHKAFDLRLKENITFKVQQDYRVNLQFHLSGVKAYTL